MPSTLVLVASVASAHSPHGTSMDVVSALLSPQSLSRHHYLLTRNLDGCGVRIIVTTIPVMPPLPADPQIARLRGKVDSDGSNFVASGGTQTVV